MCKHKWKYSTGSPSLVCECVYEWMNAGYCVKALSGLTNEILGWELKHLRKTHVGSSFVSHTVCQFWLQHKALPSSKNWLEKLEFHNNFALPTNVQIRVRSWTGKTINSFCFTKLMMINVYENNEWDISNLPKASLVFYCRFICIYLVLRVCIFSWGRKILDEWRQDLVCGDVRSTRGPPPPKNVCC